MEVGGTRPSPGDDAPAASRRSRPRPAVLISALALVIVAALAAWWFGTSHRLFGAGLPGAAQSEESRIADPMPIDQNGVALNLPARDAADPGSAGGAVCLPLSIAASVALTGPEAERDGGIKNGAQLAVDKHNGANPGCQVQLKLFDTGGNPNRAADIVPEIVNDPYTVGVIGPRSAAEVKAMGGLFDVAGMAVATPAATEVALSANRWKTFFRGLANDEVHGESVANYLKDSRRYASVCVVDDASDNGRELARAVRMALGPVAPAICTISIDSAQTDFAGAVDQVSRVSPDAVFYAGNDEHAASFVQQLRRGGVTATFVGGGMNEYDAFAARAGASASGSLLTCACAPMPISLADEYAARFGGRPVGYAAEAYDLATIMLEGIGRGVITRPALLDFLHAYDGQGVAGHYQWTDVGELVAPVIWLYEVR